MPDIYEYYSVVDALKERLATTDQLSAHEKSIV